MTVFLCGFMGCGKSSAGRLLAKKLNTEFIDMDDYIVSKEKMSIPDIFSSKGEQYFRDTEAGCVTELCSKDAVIACGGGTMLNPVSAQTARANAAVIFIDADFETCYERIKNDTCRPLVCLNTKEQLRQIFNNRRSLYSSHSDITVDASEGSAECISKKLESAVKSMSEIRQDGGSFENI